MRAPVNAVGFVGFVGPVGVVVLSLFGASGCPPPSIERDAGPLANEDAGVVDEDVVPASEYCESIVDFFCPYYLRCGRMAADSVDVCRGVFLEACNARFEPSYVSLEAAGLLVLSRQGLAACDGHLSDVACDEQLLDLDGPCADMWRGQQPAGAACGFDIESFVCAPGTACTLDVTFCGVCESVVADGERCDLAGVTCTRESTCEDGECKPRKRIGESCAAGERCLLGALCADDLTCRGPSYSSVGEACDFENRCPFRSECVGGTCALAVGQGDACNEGTPCDSGGFCQGAVCVELVAQGGACEQGAQCETGVCVEGASCSVLPSACFP